MALDNRSAGFSLIELLVVSVIILGMTAVGVSNYSSFTDTQKLKQAGRTLKNDLRFIQTRSASGLKPSSCNSADRLVSYRVTFTLTKYTYQPVCASGLADPAQTVTLPNGVTFSPIPATFEFQVLTGASTVPDFLRHFKKAQNITQFR
jgi:prepilin-type N-terminal cleavage/methylation domain-containing protein